MIGRPLGDAVLVAGQISPADVARAAALGVTTIVNNRPDLEEPDQPTSAEIEAAARAASLSYRHIPIASGYRSDDIDAMGGALAGARGTTLAFCRSGTRSTILWALARAREGAEPGLLIAQAAAAGYDLDFLRPYLVQAPAPAARG